MYIFNVFIKNKYDSQSYKLEIFYKIELQQEFNLIENTKYLYFKIRYFKLIENLY